MITEELKEQFAEAIIIEQETKDDIKTLWVDRNNINKYLNYLKNDISQPYKMLYDLTVIDETRKQNSEKINDSDYTVVYHLLSFDRNEDLRIKVGLKSQDANIPTITNIWENANWYEREAYDMFGVKFSGHPDLRRILMPKNWNGYPLRKEHPARATEMGIYKFTEQKRDEEDEILHFKPEEYGLEKSSDDSDYMFLNLGPQHPGTHGLLRLILQLDGEDIVNIIPDIGFHHRGAEKMAERQTWHKYIPYTDRIDYLSGVMNNFVYVMAVEKLGGIKIPERAQVIRIMMSELFRVINHLVWLGTFAQDLGQMSPAFYTFNDRERALDIVAAITGGRMHPSWFRIGGVAHDLPEGWDKKIKEYIKYQRKSITEFENLIIKNSIIKGRTVGIGVFNQKEAIEWGITGPNLRATGFNWDFRKKRPYSGFENFEFEVPLGKNGDCYDRSLVRMEEMKQSLRIIEQCVNNMPEGDFKSNHPLTTPPKKDKTMTDIETLINHFLNVTWGPVIPAGEAFMGIEASKGNNGYYLISDGNTSAYRCRIRTPSFPHIQMVPYISKGYTVADLLAIIGSIDFVLADLDR